MRSFFRLKAYEMAFLTVAVGCLATSRGRNLLRRGPAGSPAPARKSRSTHTAWPASTVARRAGANSSTRVSSSNSFSRCASPFALPRRKAVGPHRSRELTRGGGCGRGRSSRAPSRGASAPPRRWPLSGARRFSHSHSAGRRFWRASPTLRRSSGASSPSPAASTRTRWPTFGAPAPPGSPTRVRTGARSHATGRPSPDPCPRPTLPASVRRGRRAGARY